MANKVKKYDQPIKKKFPLQKSFIGTKINLGQYDMVRGPIYYWFYRVYNVIQVCW